MNNRTRTALGISLAMLTILPVTAATASTPPPAPSSTLQDVTSAVLVGTTTSDEDLVGDATNCHPGGPVTKHAQTTYTDALGRPAFTIHNDVTFSWNCKVVTSISHNAWVDSYSPLYRFGGWIANTDTGQGTPTAYAIAQARVGVCTDIVLNGCFLESDPYLNWVVNARGGNAVHGGGGGA